MFAWLFFFVFGILFVVIKMDKKQRMIELVEILNEASKAYYATEKEIMTNFEYDALYDELESLEKELQITLSNSPTQRVGYEVLSELEKVQHDSPMLSLDKTKDRDQLRNWLNFHPGILSWKLDGLTIVLTYENGELKQAVTRGNGTIGEDITNNAKVFDNIPLKINYQDRLVLRGEALITYEDFEKINASIEIESEKYKNPRNLCSGSVRQLNNRITKERHVRFVAFALISNVEALDTRKKEMTFLSQLGFEVVEHKVVTEVNILEEIETFEKAIINNKYPSDGLVLCYDERSYGESLGRTAKFPRDAIAFKWQDEQKETKLLEIEWSASRTGLINPVAIFEPIELEGTTVSRASLHNLSIMEKLEIGIGDTIRVYKANMIIPQISENLTRSNNLEIPSVCPVCGSNTTIKDEAGVKTLYCVNPDCLAKLIKKLEHFVSRDALNIEGLSEATLEKFIDLGYIKDFSDLFKIKKYQFAIENLDGFGEKSYANLEKAIEKAKHTDLVRVIYGLGIPNIGLANAKLLVKHFKGNLDEMMHTSMDELLTIDGFGDIMARAFVEYMQDEKHVSMINELVSILDIEAYQGSSDVQIFEGVTFCVTGSVNIFKNRKEVEAIIEQKGGKLTKSVTSKTTYLINNDITSNSSKNKKAKELNIPIIDEATFAKWVEEGEISNV